MDALVQDLRFAWRSVIKAPGFTFIAVLCLALGIGVNSAVFSIADTTQWRPLPFSDPQQLVALYATQPANNVPRSNTSYRTYLDWREQTRAFAEMAAHSYRSISITEGVVSDRYQGSAISWNLFPLLRIDPALGRQFRADDDRAGAAPVVILSDALWRRRYAGDPAILGRSIVVNGRAHIVIAVMPPLFQFPQVSELWIPLAPLEHASSRQVRTVTPYARLAADVSMTMASTELASVAERLGKTERDEDGWSGRVVTMRDDLMPASIQTASVAMMGAVTLVLLVACANVANLLLARATAREREIAVRAALGAGRRRLIRQLLTESVLLGLLSAPLGVVIAYGGLELLTSSVPPGVTMPYYVDWSMNRRVIAYTVVVAILTGVIFGLAPALQASARNLFGTLKDGGRGAGGSRGRKRTRQVLVVAEVAFSLVLVVGASLFVRSFLELQQADPGIETAPLMTMRVLLAGDAYATPEAITNRMEDVLRRVEALPGVTAAFASSLIPLGGGGTTGPIAIDGVAAEPGKEPRVFYFGATPHVLKTIDTPLVAGREFTDAEALRRSGVAIVNQAFVKRFWAKEADVVGRRFRLLSEPPDQWLTVVGVVSDFQPLLVSDTANVEPLAVVPFPYQTVRDAGITIRVGGATPASITTLARRSVGESDPELSLFDVRTGTYVRELRVWSRGLLSWMFSIFGAVALFLASIGIYGVLAYSVAQRTQEFGVRAALGATRRHIFSGVLIDGVRLAGVGIGLGVVGAVLVTRVIQSLLYNVTATDVISFGGTMLLLAAVTILAGWGPASRATGIEPIVALRAE